MEQFNTTPRNKVKRIPKRGHYDKTTVYEILDAAFMCHVGFSIEGQPFVIPTAYGRDGDVIYLHGATTSRMLKHLEQEGMAACLTVTHLDGVVLARSSFNSSMNYRSAVVFGTATLLEGDEKMHALAVITDSIWKGRWDEARLPNAKEMKATKVLKLHIESASAKIRTGGPGDEKADYELPIWAGVIPMTTQYGAAIPDEVLREGIETPASVTSFFKENKA